MIGVQVTILAPVIAAVVTTAALVFKDVRVFSVMVAVPPVFINTPDEYPNVVADKAVVVSVPDVKFVDKAEATQLPAALIERLVSVTVTVPMSTVTFVVTSGEMIDVKTALPGTDMARPPT